MSAATANSLGRRDADKPPAPLELRRALAVIEKNINEYVINARLGPAA
jgi:hypothetical protein